MKTISRKNEKKDKNNLSANKQTHITNKTSTEPKQFELSSFVKRSL